MFRKRSASYVSVAAFVTAVMVLTLSPATVAGGGLPLQLVASGLTKPVFLTNAGDERLFVVEQTGKIKIIGGGTFLDLSSRIRAGSEQGLLGLAFHPDYATNGLFYVKYSRKSDGDAVIAEYKRSDGNPDVADPSSFRQVMRINQPTEGHNGGWMAFNGPNLYISDGDAALAKSPAQDVQSLLGKILRIDPLDPDGAGPLNYTIPADNPFVGIDGRDQIWARGLRNPWRCSFDRVTAYLWCGDVGQSTREEIDRSETGRDDNYGWPRVEGTLYYKYPGHTAGQQCTGNCYDLPIAQYSHGGSKCAVTGGYVSRRVGASLEGKYVFGDYCSGQVWVIPADFTAGSQLPAAIVDTKYQISSFGEDFSGQLYLVNYKGSIYRLTGS